MLSCLKKPLLILAAGVGAVAASGLIAAYFLQNKILYLPSLPGLPRKPEDNPPMYRSPDERGLPFEQFTLVTEDSVKLSGWFIHQPQSALATTIVFMHENAGNIGFRLDFFQMLHAHLKVNIIAVSYRGYGYSQGSPSEHGIQQDAKAVLKYTFETAPIDRSKVIVFGRSLGGAVAIHSLFSQPTYPVRDYTGERTDTGKHFHVYP